MKLSHVFGDKVSFVNCQFLAEDRVNKLIMENKMTTHTLSQMINTHEFGSFRNVLAMIGTWRKRIRNRRELARLTEHELHDIGQSWSSIAEEVNKPFWRA